LVNELFAKYVGAEMIKVVGRYHGGNVDDLLEQWTITSSACCMR